MNQETQISNPIGITDLEQYFTRYGWFADRIDNTSIQTGFSEANLLLPLVVQIDEDYIYFRMGLFPGATLDQDTNYSRLMQLNDSAPIVKLSVGQSNELVASIEYLVAQMNYDLFETTVGMLTDFVRSFYEEIVAAVRLIEASGA